MKFLAVFEPRIGELALEVRRLVLEEAPEASELIYAYNAVASGYSFTGRPSDAFIHIAVYAKWVNLGFNRGSSLADPEGILRGDCKPVRHIRISELVDLKNAALQRLVRGAIAAAERPESKPEPASVVRAVYPNGGGRFGLVALLEGFPTRADDFFDPVQFRAPEVAHFIEAAIYAVKATVHVAETLVYVCEAHVPMCTEVS